MTAVRPLASSSSVLFSVLVDQSTTLPHRTFDRAGFTCAAFALREAFCVSYSLGAGTISLQVTVSVPARSRPSCGSPPLPISRPSAAVLCVAICIGHLTIYIPRNRKDIRHSHMIPQMLSADPDRRLSDYVPKIVHKFRFCVNCFLFFIWCWPWGRRSSHSACFLHLNSSADNGSP